MAYIQQVFINPIPAAKLWKNPCYKNPEMGICRVCLRTSLMLVNIFNCSSKLGIRIADMIIEAIGCKVSPGDSFPKTICPPCLKDVHEFYLLELELRFITFFQSESLRTQELKTKNIEIKLEVDTFGDQVKSEPSSSESKSESESSESDKKIENKLMELNEGLIKNDLLTTKPESPKFFLIPTIEQNIEQFKCFRCQAYFVRKGQLYKHLRTHTGKHHNHRKKLTFPTQYRELSYKCAFCPRAYTQKRSLISHIYSHFGERPYKCFQCMNTFSRMSSLKRHQARSCLHLKKEKLTKDIRSKPGVLYQEEYLQDIKSEFFGGQKEDLKDIKYKFLASQGEEKFQDTKYNFFEGQEEGLQYIKSEFLGGQEEALQDIKYDFFGGQAEPLQDIKYEFHGGQQGFQDIKYDFFGGQEEALQDIKYDFFGGQAEPLQDIKYDFHGGQQGFQDINYNYLGSQVKQEFIEDESNFQNTWTNWNVNSWQEQDIKPPPSHNGSLVHYLSSRYYY